jgi:protein-S-isoprenylcysteine O-methyltransferase Ste14
MGQKMFAAVRGVIYATGFFFAAVWFVPRFIKIRTSLDLPLQSSWRVVGTLPLVIGAAIVGWCFFNFAVVGRGTPAPFDAPRRLVVTGPYCYVRNPMYIGGLLFLAGCVVLFAEFSLTLLWYAFGLLIGVNLFVLFYEEPTLRRKFRADYEEYCRNVRRWIPHLRPWLGAIASAATGST